jgi:hypothetical protein
MRCEDFVMNLDSGIWYGNQSNHKRKICIHIYILVSFQLTDSEVSELIAQLNQFYELHFVNRQIHLYSSVAVLVRSSIVKAMGAP